LGTLITTINEGVSAFSNVILYPNKYIIPRLHITPNNTTINDKIVVLIERKKSNNIRALKRNDPNKKYFISF